MSEEADGLHVAIEPFDRDRRDRTAFSCGVEQVSLIYSIKAGGRPKAAREMIVGG